MRESRTYGSVRGALSNGRPYRVRHCNPCTSFAAVHESGIDAVDGSSTRPVSAVEWLLLCNHDSEEPNMQMVTTIGLDIAKSVFQVHGVDAAGQVVIRRQLKRRAVLAFFQKLPPCLVGIEACASSHHWSRELQVLGHCVRLMTPAYVKPYVKRQKNDMADAEAICEAVTRANMRFVPTKTPEQQSCLLVLSHDRRQLLWFEVTRHPTAEWLDRQIIEAFPWASAIHCFEFRPRY